MENSNEKFAPVMSVKDWVITNIVSFIPIIGLIMILKWAFGSEPINENKRNWAKALFWIEMILIALVILVYAAFSIYALIVLS